MEGAPGLVRVMGLGVGQLQLVKVCQSTMHVSTAFFVRVFTELATPSVSCGSPPSIPNGSAGTPSSTMVGGTVTYSCDIGYIMSDAANNLVTCLSIGEWSAPPSCQSELISWRDIYVV